MTNQKVSLFSETSSDFFNLQVQIFRSQINLKVQIDDFAKNSFFDSKMKKSIFYVCVFVYARRGSGMSLVAYGCVLGELGVKV